VSVCMLQYLSFGIKIFHYTHTYFTVNSVPLKIFEEKESSHTMFLFHLKLWRNPVQQYFGAPCSQACRVVMHCVIFSKEMFGIFVARSMVGKNAKPILYSSCSLFQCSLQ